MRFWDASEIIPLCMDEAVTARVRRLAKEDSAVVVWWGTPVERYSALVRRRRERIISRADEDQATRDLSLLIEEWTEIEPSRAVRDTAIRILRLHPLRAADSLQLSAAPVWADGRPTGSELVCLDQRLREAARCEGFLVLPER